MCQLQQYTWEEDCLQPSLVGLGGKQPNCGKTYVMYHGTHRTNAPAIQKEGFRPSWDGLLGRGVYLSRDLNKASRYPLGVPESQRVVFRVTVNVGNVIAINYVGHSRQKNWHDGRYGEVFDTAWCPPDCGMTKSGMEEDCIWDPSRIKIDRMIAPTLRTSRSEMQQYSWEEDCPQLLSGVKRLDGKQPNNSETYILYHGTNRKNMKTIKRNGFQQSRDGILGRGVYFSGDLIEASRFPLDVPESQRVVFRVKVKVGNVIAINCWGHPRQKTWNNRRYKEWYDTAWCPPNCGMTKSGVEGICVGDPSHILIDQMITPTPW